MSQSLVIFFGVDFTLLQNFDLNSSLNVGAEEYLL